MIRDLLAACTKTGEVRDDVAPDELAGYCLHALEGASDLPSKAAVRRLVAVTLTGLGRGLPDLTLEALPAGTAEWQPLGGVTAAADGSVQVTIKATAPVQYRLTSGGVSSEPTKLLVAPKVRLKLPSAPTALSGTVRPPDDE